MSDKLKFKSANEFVDQLIDAIGPLKVESPKTKPEKFVNVGIEAVKRLLIDNKQLMAERIEEYADKKQPAILENVLFTDNASEALYEVIQEGYGSASMLVCEAIDKNGTKYQIHIRAVRDKSDDSIGNEELMPVFGIDDENRLIPLK